ncbi:MAG: hypothetical protein DRP12_00095 [Candidatus Aenigmatarchaeota archaeon]|nr:MAG: hypothetical protein DRP12_00095 [Candidatus Aenigmarchaeota archaeon]
MDTKKAALVVGAGAGAIALLLLSRVRAAPAPPSPPGEVEVTGISVGQGQRGDTVGVEVSIRNGTDSEVRVYPDVVLIDEDGIERKLLDLPSLFLSPGEEKSTSGSFTIPAMTVAGNNPLKIRFTTDTGASGEADAVLNVIPFENPSTVSVSNMVSGKSYSAGCRDLTTDFSVNDYMYFCFDTNCFSSPKVRVVVTEQSGEDPSNIWTWYFEQENISPPADCSRINWYFYYSPPQPAGVLYEYAKIQESRAHWGYRVTVS